MVNTIIFSGPPIPLARPRLGKWGVYDSQSQLKKKIVDDLLRQTWQKLDGPIAMDFLFKMPVPKCSKKKERELMREVYHIKRPDLSNMIKFYEDCLQGHVYDDDSQVVQITAKKIHSLMAETVIKLWSPDGHRSNSSGSDNSAESGRIYIQTEIPGV